MAVIFVCYIFSCSFYIYSKPQGGRGVFLLYLFLFFFILIQNLRVVVVVEEAEAELSINFDFFIFMEQKCAVLQYPPYQLA